MNRAVVICVGALLAAYPLSSGCSLLGLGGYELEIRTDREAYFPDPSDRTPDERIELTVTNKSDHIVYAACIPGIFLEELASGHRVNFWGVSGTDSGDCESAAFIKPGKTRTYVLEFADESGLGGITDARFDERAVFRLRFEAFEDSDLRRLLEEQERLSNRFHIYMLPIG